MRQVKGKIMELVIIYQLGGGGDFWGFMAFRGNGGGESVLANRV